MQPDSANKITCAPREIGVRVLVDYNLHSQGDSELWEYKHNQQRSSKNAIESSVQSNCLTQYKRSDVKCDCSEGKKFKSTTIAVVIILLVMLWGLCLALSVQLNGGISIGLPYLEKYGLEAWMIAQFVSKNPNKIL